jgi:UDP-glucose 4,6-dehydratase
MNTFITGGCGFIGSAFCHYYRKEHPEENLYIFDALYDCASKKNIEDLLDDKIHFIHGNLQDKDFLEYLFEEHQFQKVIHFAAQSHVDHSFSDPLQYTRDNIIGTHNLLEVVRRVGCVKRFCHISTDEVYGENEHGEGVKTERSLLKPTNPYAATKAAAEMIVNSYVMSYNLPIVIIRANNVYGPRQYPEKVIPKFILRLLADKPVILHGSGKQLRSFLHCDDIAAAIDIVLHKGIIGEVYNIASEIEISIFDLAIKLIQIMKPGESVEKWLQVGPDRNFNDQRYWINSDKLGDLGWRAVRVFDTEIHDVIEWYRNVKDRHWWPILPYDL